MIIQIAGIKDLAEAQMLLAEGVDQLGFPFHLPVHQEDLTFPQATQVVAQINADACALITYLSHAEEIVQAMTDLGVNKVQLHGQVATNQLERIKEKEPAAFVIRSLIIGPKSMADLEAEILETQQFVDAYLTDTFDPVTGASGATGKTHDWQISRHLVEFSSKPLILAGGLNPENVAEAIATVQPYGVDAHTGVEDESGRKSRDKVRRFVAAVRSAG